MIERGMLVVDMQSGGIMVSGCLSCNDVKIGGVSK